MHRDSSAAPLLIKEPTCWERFIFNSKTHLLLVVIICAFIGIGSPFIWQVIWKVEFDCCRIESDLRYDCLPNKTRTNQSEKECPTKYCCWDNDSLPEEIRCYYPIVNIKQKMPGYKVESASDDINLILVVDERPGYLMNVSSPTVEKNLKVEIHHFSKNHFEVKISPNDKKEDFDLMNYLDYNKSKQDLSPNKTAKDESEAVISLPKPGEIFSLTIKRRSSDKVLFNTGEFTPFIYTDQYIEMTTLLPNDLVYGLSQSHTGTFKLNFTYPQDWSIFSKEKNNLTSQQKSWYGSHPFYLGLDGDGNAYGVFLLNSHPIEVVTNSRPSLTYKTFGGTLDFHFFMGPTPSDVIKQLQTLIGKPSMPPYWALGFHLCRAECDLIPAYQVINSSLENKIPIESDCGSSIYMSLSTNNFGDPGIVKELNDFEKNCSKNHIKNIYIHSPQIFNPTEENDVPFFGEMYKRVKNSILKFKNGNNFIDYTGYFYSYQCTGVSNKSVVYPDYNHADASRFLNNYIGDTKSFTNINGIIADYNSPIDLSFSRKGNKSCTFNNWMTDYFVRLNKDTTCKDLLHPPNTQQKNISHVSLHNLYGYHHSRAIKRALQEREKLLQGSKSKRRQFVLSLSTFTGSGNFAGSWGGRIPSTWPMLKETIAQTLQFNLYGIPLTGFPVCGFTGSLKNDELCLRWYQLAAMQPLIISHRNFKEQLTDPSSLTKNDKTLESYKSALIIRYQLLPYFYTQFYYAANFSEMVIRPLFFEYPKDSKTYKIDEQFLWGKSLMVSPVTQKGAKNIKAYFPPGIWYDFYNGQRINNEVGHRIDLSAVEYHINLHIRGGHIIPTQQADGNNTFLSRLNNDFTLIVGLDDDNSATGQLFIDDGIYEDSITKGEYLLVDIEAKSNNVSIEVTKGHGNMDWLIVEGDGRKLKTIISTIRIFGIIDPPYPRYFNLTIDNKFFKRYDQSDNIVYDPKLGKLTLRDFQVDFSQINNAFISWENQFSK